MSTSKNATPTRADVAKLARTSLATVSYVVNDGPKFVAEKTRKRVLDTIETLGYRPDPIALSLRGASSNSIGMMVPNFRGPFFADLVAEVEQRAAAQGKVVIFGSTRYIHSTEQELIRTFADHRVEAVLSIGPTKELQPADRFNGAINIFRISDDDRAMSTVEIAQRAATREAAQHLLGHGRKRIAAIFGPTAHGVFKVRYRGWRDAMSYTTEQSKELVRRADYSYRGGHDAALELFSQKHRPDGLLVSNDTQAIGALSALNTMGLRIPEDVAVISIDSTEISPFLSPPLSSVAQPADLLAEGALELINTPDADPGTHITVPHRLNTRESCGCTSEPLDEVTEEEPLERAK